MAKETAEQKLLRLIESNDDAPSPKAAEPSSTEAQELLNAVSSVGSSVALPPVLGQVLGVFKNLLGKSQRNDGFGIRQVNMVLVIAVISGLAIFIASILSGVKVANRPVKFSKADSVNFSSQDLLPIIPELQRYVSAISFRNIFQPFEKKAPEEAVVTSDALQALPPQLAQKTQNLKLVGISWLDTPESASAMMENTETGITYFLRNGEQVNGVNVKTIYADSVVLELDGKEMEMKL